ncbi:hypothetical protein D3C85_1699280 [compost metagenome]
MLDSGFPSDDRLRLKGETVQTGHLIEHDGGSPAALSDQPDQWDHQSGSNSIRPGRENDIPSISGT